MKVLYLLVVLCILGVFAQRRSSNTDTTNLDASSQRPASRGRGRTRFSITPEFEQASAEYEEVTKHSRKTDIPRRKSENIKQTEKRLPRPAKEPGLKTRNYEVKEMVDDIPRDDSRRSNKKPRVITESRFEAANASPAPEEVPPNLSAFATAVPESIAEETALPGQLTTIPINAISSTEKNTEEISSESLDVSSETPKIDSELKRKQPEAIASSVKPLESRRPGHGRLGSRTRGTTAHRAEEQTTPATRTRTRTQSSRKTEESSSVAPSAPSIRPQFRPARRRGEAVAESVQESVKTRGPSVFAAENSQELPPRSRTGRKVSSASERRLRGERISETPKQIVSSTPENVDPNLARRADIRRTGRLTEPSTEGSSTFRSNKDVSTQTRSSPAERADLNLNRRVDTRRGRLTEPSTERSSSPSTTKDPLTQSTENAPEKVALNVGRKADRRRNRYLEASTEGISASRNSNKVKNVNEPEVRSQRRGGTRSTTQRNIQSTSQPIERQVRGRGRSRSFLTLNEQNLEVLPLFENEPKTVPQNYDSVTVPSRSSLGRRRSLNSAEDIATASTKQAEVKLEVDPINDETETAPQGSIRISREESISVDSKTEKAIRKVYKKRPTLPRTKQPRKLHRALAESKEETTEAVFIRKFRPLNSRKPIVGDSPNEDGNEKIDNEEKEKTVEETTEKINANEDTNQTGKINKPQVSTRPVVRKASQKLLSSKGKEKAPVELTNSEEAIGEGDNYPAPFKAAIQAKKGKQEDEEIDHKSESESTTIAPATKFPRPRFSLTTKQPRSTKNSSDAPSKTGPNRPSLPPRKYKPKPKSAATTTTQSSTDQESETSLTTTATPLQKFHARFKSSRSQKGGPDVVITPRTAHKSRSYSPKAPKGLYSSRKLSKTTIAPDTTEETEKPKPPKFSVETSALPTKVPPVGHTIKKSSRFSARYRSDILSRSHRTSTSGPTYVPTVPTVTPPPTSVKVEENELGMEIISFDDPVANTVPSANLISGDYLSSSPDPTVESKGAAAHTTEKPVSIIERIINSITSISTTTTSPDATTKTSTTTSGQPTKSSAILNLVSKKPKDKTVTIDIPLESGAQKLTNSPNSVEYRTTEKPTTIIEKILSSLSAIRADAAPETTTADPLQVGSNYNTVDTTLKLSSTESTSSIAKTTIPMSKGSSAAALPLISEGATILPTSTAFSSSTTVSTTLDSDEFNDISTIPIRTSSISARSIPSTTPLSSQTSSTTLDPTTVFEEVVSDQILPKRTIEKLLSLLNIVSPSTTTPQPTTTKLVVVTPKLTTFVTSNTEPISTEQNATPVPTILPTTLELTSEVASSSSETTTPTLFTSTLGSSADTASNDINTVVNPLSSAEPTVGSRILDMISTISRIMGSTLSPSTTALPTSALTTEGSSTVNLPNTTPAVSTTAGNTAGTSTTNFATTSGVPGTSGTSTAPTTTASVTSSTAAGTSTPTTTATSVASTVTAAANPLAITTPIAIVTDSATVSAITQTSLPISSATTQGLPSTTDSIATTPSTTTSNSAGTSTIGASTTTQGTTSTEVSVVQGSQSSAPSTTPTVIPSTVSSNTQTASTLLTTVNTTPALTSTTGAVAMTEGASTGTTGSTILTSTTKVTRETTTDSTFDAPTTLPTLLNFEVSPDRVKVFSANDISSTFVPDDPVSTTVSISARAFVPGTTLSTVADNSPVTTTQNAIPTSQPTVGTTGVSSTSTATTPSSSIGSTSTVAASTTNSISSTSTVVPLANNAISGSTVSPSTLAPIITTANSVKPASTAVDSTTQDVSSNTIDTNSVTDKQSLVNQTDVSNLVNPLSAGTNVSVADSSSTSTTNPMVAMMEFMTRDGKLLRFQPNPLQNSNTRTKDYFIFAVLPNNTILRKRPSMYPTKETPFLIYGVLPNNTLIQKFPNGTIVPMEPVIQVIGFDTRENPPPPPEIISNQVTSVQDSRPDNNKVSTVGNTVPSIEANQLSLNGGNGGNALPPLTEILGGKTVKAFNSIVNQTQGEAQAGKVHTLQVDPLVQSRVNVENVEINTISSASSSPPPPPTAAPSSTTVKPVTTSAAPQATTPPPGPPSTDAPFTTPLPLTTAVPIVTTQVVTTGPKITTAIPITTTVFPSTNPPGPPATNPTTQKIVSTTGRVASTTFLPVFLSTLLSTLQPQKQITTTTAPQLSTTVSPISTVASVSPSEATSTFSPITTTLTIPFTSPIPRGPVSSPNPLSLSIAPDFDDLPNVISTTALSPTLMDLLSNGAKISSTPLPNTVSSTVSSLKNINLKQKKLTEQQKKDLETLEALEKEQEAILQQLAFLTGLNLGGAAPPKKNDNLADRVIAQAIERGTTTNSPPAFNLLETLSPKDSRQSKSIAPAPSVEDLLKQINVNGLNSVTPAGPIVTSTYGKTNDALLASLLKEYGVVPPTPKVFSGAYDKEISITTRAPIITTTKRSVTTTQAPGRIMQGLNWLLNALAPPPSAKPAQAKPKPKPKPAKNNEVLSQQPTEITPVIVEAPDQPGEETKIGNNVISQNQLKALVKQLEEIQKDPKKAKDLDIEALKALQNIESLQKSGVQVIAASSTGATSRTTTPKLSSTKSIGATAKYTSPLPLSVSNSILEDVGPTISAKSTLPPVDLKNVPGVAADLEAATTKSKIPRVKLNPVPGVPDENPRIRGQLVNYAINVTKAISTFLGSAIQGAANSFQTMIGSGSRTAGNSNRPG